MKKRVSPIKFVDPWGTTVRPSKKRIQGRKVLTWSTHCYGVWRCFGLKLEGNEDFPEEWLILKRPGQTVQVIAPHSKPSEYDDDDPLYNLQLFCVGERIKEWKAGNHVCEIGFPKVVIRLDKAFGRHSFPHDKKSDIIPNPVDLRKSWVLWEASDDSVYFTPSRRGWNHLPIK